MSKSKNLSLPAYRWALYFLSLTGAVFSANSYMLIKENLLWLTLVVPVFAAVNCLAGTLTVKTSSLRLRACHHGVITLGIFCLSSVVSAAYHTALAFELIPKEDYWSLIWSAVICVLFESVLFWNGIISVYVTSLQLGIKQRVIGIALGLIPIANLVALFFIIKITAEEVRFETEKEHINAERKDKRICGTKYPVLLVHGVFFRDRKYLNYWGRIPAELEANGAVICYGNHQSAASVKDSAIELTLRIKQIVKEMNCEKVNIIAHSKGGLDCRYALENLDAAPYIASLTTVSSPHKGANFADCLLEKSSPSLQQSVARVYNAALRKFGDENPDFMAAVKDLTTAASKKLWSGQAPEGVYCQSVGSVMPKAAGGKFPLNFSYLIAKNYEGLNDGIVNEVSFPYGENYTLIKPLYGRGISHGDMIDLNRENIKGFDVREFYVQLVSGLRERGL